MSQPSGTTAPTASPTTTASPTGTASPDDRATEFKPVSGAQLQSGEKLLVEAYSAIWLIVFAFVLFSWRRLQRLDQRIDALEGAVARARNKDGDPPRKKAG